MVFTNKRELMYGVDFFRHWPFITFENLTEKGIEEK